MSWGIEKESVARNAYVDTVKDKHMGFEVENAGLYVNPESPHLGASPDGLVCCQCCGPGLLEIKCPYSVRNTTPTSATYIQPKEDGDGFQLNRKHNYYFQIQGQMAIFDRTYCDFACWTLHGLHVERICYDPDLVNYMIPKLDDFFLKIILPEVLCDGEQQQPTMRDIFCYCRQGESGKMIACDSPSCEFIWFHYTCLKLPQTFDPGENEWLCPDCIKKCDHLPTS